MNSVQATKQEIIKSVEQLKSESLLDRLRHFLSRAIKVESITTKAFSKVESELLIKINKGLPEETQSKYNAFNKKLINGELNEQEHKELLVLIPQVEAQNVKRLKYLAQLAQIWNLSVDDTMIRLGITSPPVTYAE